MEQNDSDEKRGSSDSKHGCQRGSKTRLLGVLGVRKLSHKAESELFHKEAEEEKNKLIEESSHFFFLNEHKSRPVQPSQVSSL